MNQNVDKIRADSIELRIPFLWENLLHDTHKLVTKLDSPKSISRFKNNLIIVIENEKSRFMKFIIQSLTGIDTNCFDKSEIEDEKESILYGPFNPSDLIQRTSRCYPKFESGLFEKKKQNVSILYLRGYKKDDFPSKILDKALFFISVKSIQKSADKLPKTSNKPIYLFFDLKRENEENNIIMKKELRKSCDRFIINNDPEDTHDAIQIPIIMENLNNLEKIGPLTNKCLRFAFNKMFKRKRCDEDK